MAAKGDWEKPTPARGKKSREGWTEVGQLEGSTNPFSKVGENLVKVPQNL